MTTTNINYSTAAGLRKLASELRVPMTQDQVNDCKDALERAAVSVESAGHVGPNDQPNPWAGFVRNQNEGGQVNPNQSGFVNQNQPGPVDQHGNLIPGTGRTKFINAQGNETDVNGKPIR